MKFYRLYFFCFSMFAASVAWGQDDYEEATFTGKKDKPVVPDIEDENQVENEQSA